MNIDDSIHRWEAYTQLFQKLVDSFENDIQNDNVVDVLEAVFMCNLQSLLISAFHISEQALGIAQFTKKKLQEDDIQDVSS